MNKIWLLYEWDHYDDRPLPLLLGAYSSYRLGLRGRDKFMFKDWHSGQEEHYFLKEVNVDADLSY